MVYNFKVFKKCSPNGKLTLYMGKRDFVDHISYVEPIDGIVVVDEEYVRDRRVFAQVVCTFRYGREEDEVMGLSFYKELYLASEQIYPPLEKRSYELSRTQERLVKKLGDWALPFRLTLPAGAPGSVTLQPGLEDEGEPCGVHYYVKLFVGETEIDRSHRRSTVALGIRKVQYAPEKPGPQPCTLVRKDFVLSPGQLELELTLDKQVRHIIQRLIRSTVALGIPMVQEKPGPQPSILVRKDFVLSLGRLELELMLDKQVGNIQRLIRSTVSLGKRKVQEKPGPQPCTLVGKDFVFSPGQLELELTFDKQLRNINRPLSH